MSTPSSPTRVGYSKIEKRVNHSVPEWKEWPRRLRRIYASLESHGSSEAAIQDAVETWGWKWADIQKLRNASPTFEEALEAYREKRDYPTGNGWKNPVTCSQLETVYIREGELDSYAILESDKKATAFHRDIVDKNDMLGMSEPLAARRDIETHEDQEQIEREYEDRRVNPVETDSGLGNDWQSLAGD